VEGCLKERRQLVRTQPQLSNIEKRQEVIVAEEKKTGKKGRRKWHIRESSKRSREGVIGIGRLVARCQGSGRREVVVESRGGGKWGEVAVAGRGGRGGGGWEALRRRH